MLKISISALAVLAAVWTPSPAMAKSAKRGVARYEAVAARARVKIAGPQITWGTMPNYGDPVAWLDAFYAAYEGANGGRQPTIDFLGFH